MASKKQNLQNFLNFHVSQIRPLLKDLYLAEWEFDTTGNKAMAEKKKQLDKEYIKLYANKAEMEKCQALCSHKISDLPTRRQMEIILNLFRFYKGQVGERMERTVDLEIEVKSIYNHFRGSLDGKQVNDNQIKQILRQETNSALRQKVWEASKQIGKQVADKVLEIVRLRNESAREAGYSDYYALSLECKEMIQEKEMFETMGKLKELTDQPFRKLKSALDQDLSSRFGIRPEEMRPWHYAEPFFQAVPPRAKVDLSPFFKNADIIEMTRSTYKSIGLDVDDILRRADLFPKENKYQHAFCNMIDRDTKDIRILCNIDQSEYWASTMLHEFGHGIYDKSISPDLPFILHEAAHTLSTEAIAMMMETLTKNAGWLVKIVKAPEQEVAKIAPDLENEWKIKHLIFVRWGLVMVHFERELYRNPNQDLNRLWWDLVEKFQFVHRPEGRNEPDWASKTHIANSPVYYHNYLYGQMVARQLLAYIQKNVGTGRLYDNPELGKYLVEKYFSSGRKYDWNETLKIATGEELNVEKYAGELQNFGQE